MTDSKTIAQIAAELGVSRQAVYQRIRYNKELSTELCKFTVNEGNKKLYTLQGQELIKSAFSKSDAVNSKVSIDSKQNSESLQAVIEILREQLAVKDTQIAEKDKQISSLTEQVTNLTTTLNQQQALHAGTIQSMLMQQQQEPAQTDTTKTASVSEPSETESKPTEQASADQTPTPPEPQQKLSFFARLFRKRSE